MTDIDELILKSQELCDGLIRLKKASQAETAPREDEAERVRALAKKHPIRGHILCSSDEYVRGLYMAALCSLINREADAEKRGEAMLLAARILAAFDQNADLRTHISAAMKIDAEFIANFAESVKGNTAVAFAADALLLASVGGSADKSVSELAAEYIALSGIGADLLSDICALVEGILRQDDAAVLKTERVDLNLFVEYMRDAPKGYIARDPARAKGVEGDLLITNAKIANLSEVIDLDQYKAKSITFYACRFSNIRGIIGGEPTVCFEKCDFEDNNISECLIKIETCNIENCRFINCKGNVNLFCSFLIDIKKGSIKDSIFEQCEMKATGRKDDVKKVTGGIVALQGGKITNCRFLRCKARGSSDYISNYYIYVVKLVRAIIEGSEFTECRASDGGGSNRYYTSTSNNYILALSDSTDNNTIFNACEAGQGEDSKNKTSHLKGEISSSDM
jgi:hypothetical protein